MRNTEIAEEAGATRRSWCTVLPEAALRFFVPPERRALRMTTKTKDAEAGAATEE
jgi:hypothetical protein